MALILSLAVEPTVKAYLLDDKKTVEIFQLVIDWFNNRELPTEEKINQLFPQQSLGLQAIDEAVDVFKNLLRVLNPAKAKEALLEILDDCLEGYAVFPGAEERRDLFNWWLLEVVPAAWCLQYPESIYTIKGLVSCDLKTLPTKLLNLFDNYKSTEIVNPNNSFRKAKKDLYNHLNISLDKVSFEQLSNYTAVEYYLTIEDIPAPKATNLEKVNRYLEAFHHLCKPEDWENALKIFAHRLDTPTNDELHNQLHTWGYYQEEVDLHQKLLGKLNPEIETIILNGLSNIYNSLGDYQ